MTVDPQRRLRLTVLGYSTAVPHPASPASGYLVTWDTTSILLDAGQGVASRLARQIDPRDLAAVLIGHMHADHYIDLAALRYLYPWGAPAARRLAVHLPPGGRDRMTALATAISEREGFFDSAFDIAEYDDQVPLQIGDLTVRFGRSQHYVPAWAMAVETPGRSPPRLSRGHRADRRGRRVRPRRRPPPSRGGPPLDRRRRHDPRPPDARRSRRPGAPSRGSRGPARPLRPGPDRGDRGAMRGGR